MIALWTISLPHPTTDIERQWLEEQGEGLARFPIRSAFAKPSGPAEDSFPAEDLSQDLGAGVGRVPAAGRLENLQLLAAENFQARPAARRGMQFAAPVALAPDLRDISDHVGTEG